MIVIVSSRMNRNSPAAEHLKREQMDIENESRRSLKWLGLMVGSRIRRTSCQVRVSVLVAADPQLLAASDISRSAKPDARRGTDDLRGWPPTIFQL
jgi:hypothetical protein